MSMLLGSVVTAEDAGWPQHLGPQRNGLSQEKNLLDSWPASGLEPVWRAAGGVGMSGLAIRKDQLFTLVQREGKQWVVAHNAQRGTAQWQTSIAPEYKNAMGDGPRATPTVTEDRLFAFTGEGILAALSTVDGQIVWSHNVVKELGGEPAEYGMASSPLLAEGLAIVTAGAPQATVAAYDMRTGKLAWTAGSGSAAGYSSPALLDVAGQHQVVVFAGNAVLGLAPANGTVLWRYPFVTDYDCNIATPLAHNGQVFISSGENHGCAMLSITAQGHSFQVREVWSSLGPRSVLRNEWQTSLLLDGHLYGFDNVGGAGPITHLTCVEANSGERIWQESRFGKGNAVAADGKLFIVTLQGELIVARVSPKGYEELGRTAAVEATRQAPALVNGRLYLRDDSHIMCFDVRR